MRLIAVAFENFPEIDSSSNLAETILQSAIENEWDWKEGDIVILAQKIVSKAENRFFNIKDVQPDDLAKKYAHITGKDPRLVELILRESSKVLRTRNGLIIVQHKLGFICANAGIDHSNVRGDAGEFENVVLLLPENPDKSASIIRSQIYKLINKNIGVIIIDSHGRPWRKGVVGVSIGMSGVPPVIDRRGLSDRFGYKLKITEIGVADELAASASLLMGQADEGRPVVALRGFPYLLAEGQISDILRKESEDLFR